MVSHVLASLGIVAIKTGYIFFLWGDQELMAQEMTKSYYEKGAQLVEPRKILIQYFPT